MHQKIQMSEMSRVINCHYASWEEELAVVYLYFLYSYIILQGQLFGLYTAAARGVSFIPLIPPLKPQVFCFINSNKYCCMEVMNVYFVCQAKDIVEHLSYFHPYRLCVHTIFHFIANAEISLFMVWMFVKLTWAQFHAEHSLLYSMSLYIFLIYIYHLCCMFIDFYDLSTWNGCWFVVYIRRFIYKFLNVCPFDYTAVVGSGKVGP